MYYAVNVGTLSYRRRSIETCLRPGVYELSDVCLTREKSEIARGVGAGGRSR